MSAPAFSLISETDDRRVADFFGVPEHVWSDVPALASSADWRGYDREGMLHPGRNSPIFARRLVERYSKRNDIVSDPCAGIGTFLVEAAKLGRYVTGVEVEPDYFAILQRNLKRFYDGAGQPSVCALVRGDFASLTGDDRAWTRNASLILTSPPYPWQHSPGKTEKQRLRLVERSASAGTDFKTDGAGNLCRKGVRFWEQLEAIYRAALNREVPAARLVVIVRDSVKDGAFVPFSRQVGEVMQAAGWKLVEVVTRPLRPSCGHQRRLKLNPAALFFPWEFALVAIQEKVAVTDGTILG